jgi:uncharacterized damage-inducible protein DinB
MLSWFRRLARYNRIANERLYEACASLDDTEYRRAREVSFGSIHALLNHLLLSDRIWMARFEGGSGATPPLDTVLFDQFTELRAARAREDGRIEEFFGAATDAFFSGRIKYVNSKGQQRADDPALAAGHFFNHQTHHRGQIHAMLAQAAIPPPSLDLHWILDP